MIPKFRGLFRKSEKKSIFCIDTCFIEGTILKHIERDTWNIKIKDDFNERLRRLNRQDIILLINEINEFEIKSKLMRQFSLSLNKANFIYDNAMILLKNISKAEIKDIKLTPRLINWMLVYGLDFKDGLLISIAERLELPFVTSERNAEKWKNAYSGVLKERDFWDLLEKDRGS